MNESIITFLEAIQKQPEKRAAICNTYGCEHQQTKVTGGWICDLCGEFVPDEQENDLLTRLTDAGFGSAGTF